MPAATAGGFWLGFGFNGFGQVNTVLGAPDGDVNSEGQQSGMKILSPEPLRVGEGLIWGGLHPVSKLFPSWSRTLILTGDGCLVPSGFPGVFPGQIHGCRDLLASEHFLLLLFQDRVECWDTRPDSEGTKETPIWQMELADSEHCAFPLVSKGYVVPKPPFFRPLAPEKRALKLVLGTEHAMLLGSDKMIYSWGSGRHGQLGHCGLADEAEPRVVEALQGLAMVDVAAGGWHSVSVSDGGDIYIWGWNESGQLAFPSKALSETKGQIPDGQRAEPGKPSDSALGESFCPGGGTQQESGSAEVFISIQAFPALLDLPKESEVSKVSCGSRHTAAVTRDGDLYTWGWGAYGQLGHGDKASYDEPKIVQYFSECNLSVQDVVCGPWNTFVFAVNK